MVSPEYRLAIDLSGMHWRDRHSTYTTLSKRHRRLHSVDRFATVVGHSEGQHCSLVAFTIVGSARYKREYRLDAAALVPVRSTRRSSLAAAFLGRQVDLFQLPRSNDSPNQPQSQKTRGCKQNITHPVDLTRLSIGRNNGCSNN